MMKPDVYDRVFVERIQHAYRSIFPTMTPALTEYWGLNRVRPWALITSDFHRATYDQYASLHARTLVIASEQLGAKDKAEALRRAALECEVGFSIGVCPWTDHLLHETWSDEKDSVTILLGHDWYPIVIDGTEQLGSPLRANDALRYTERYWPAAPQAVFDGATIGLFLNLYPDYRPPEDPKCGSLTGYGYSYESCLLGLDAVIDAVCDRYKKVQMISWGSNVWRALVGRVSTVNPKTLLTKHISGNSGQVLTFVSGQHAIPYLPIVHPALWGNFGRVQHLAHVKKGFGAMGLGLPGPNHGSSIRLSNARTILC